MGARDLRGLGGEIKMSMRHINALGLVLALTLASTGCRDTSALVEVQVIRVHRWGDTLDRRGWFREPYDYAIYERVDTGERIFLRKVWGEQGETFHIRVSRFEN